MLVLKSVDWMHKIKKKRKKDWFWRIKYLMRVSFNHLESTASGFHLFGGGKDSHLWLMCVVLSFLSLLFFFFWLKNERAHPSCVLHLKICLNTFLQLSILKGVVNALRNLDQVLLFKNCEIQAEEEDLHTPSSHLLQRLAFTERNFSCAFSLFPFPPLVFRSWHFL